MVRRRHTPSPEQLNALQVARKAWNDDPVNRIQRGQLQKASRAKNKAMRKNRELWLAVQEIRAEAAERDVTEQSVTDQGKHLSRAHFANMVESLK